jgi:hypothetical protein
LKTSYEGKEYLRYNEVVSPTENCESLEFLHDWWEGQEYIKLLGIRNLHEIELIPTADVVEVRHGEWQYEQLDEYKFYKVTCPYCGAYYYGNYDAYHDPDEFNYCPNCGAKMDGERSENGT